MATTRLGKILIIALQKADVMHPQKFSGQLHLFKLTAMGAIVVILFGLFSAAETASSQAPQPQPSKQEIERVPPGQEKKFHIGVPANLPLKIKVKNVNSKKWAHDIAVEVTNTADKPIYFLDFYIILPGINGLLGDKVGFWLHYGRAELIDFSTPVLPDDVPLQPGDKYTFKIQESSAKGWDYLREKEGRPEPKVIKLIFQGLNFGDGTGYSDTSGAPVNIHKKASLNKPCVPPPRWSLDISTQVAFSFLPASFLPVRFSEAETFKSLEGKTLSKPDVCCSQSSCNYVKRGSYICGRTCSENSNRPSADFVGCSALILAVVFRLRA